MDLFDNLVLESFDFLLEGEQAEAYKKRKAEEKDAEEAAYIERKNRRIAAGPKMTDKNPEKSSKKRYRGLKDDLDRDMDSIDRENIYYKNNPKSKYSSADAWDGINRHLRRHSKNESVYDDYE